MDAIRRSLVHALSFVVLIGAPGRASAQEPAEPVDAALASRGLAPGALRADVIVAWNGLAHDLAVAEDQFLTFKGQRALAMVHLAMHDALNAIVPVYDRYAHTGRPRLAHPVAAAAQAAHDVLVAQYPDKAAAIAAELARTLSGVAPGALRESGLAIGKDAAAAVIAVRAGDGWDVPGTYEFADGQAGRYQTTPPWNGFVAQPGFRAAKPFVLEYPHQFRPAPPPPLKSKAYATAFREVKTYGGADSTRRTAEQTDYAIWWMEFAEGSVNRLARRLAIERRMPLWAAARLFALIGVVLYDGYVATWDAKYEYDHWRPYTAIRGAAADGNPGTTPDPGWESLRPAPPFPEYSSAHAAACGASFGVLADAFGREVAFTMETTTAPPGMPTRTFASFEAAAAECADSRVRLGFHFRYATDAGLTLGRRIARHVVGHALRATDHSVSSKVVEQHQVGIEPLHLRGQDPPSVAGRAHVREDSRDPEPKPARAANPPVAEPVDIDRVEVGLSRDEHDPGVRDRPQERPDALEHDFQGPAGDRNAHEPAGDVRAPWVTVEIVEISAVRRFTGLEAAAAGQPGGLAPVGGDPPDVRDRAPACR